MALWTSDEAKDEGGRRCREPGRDAPSVSYGYVSHASRVASTERGGVLGPVLSSVTIQRSSAVALLITLASARLHYRLQCPPGVSTRHLPTKADDW